MSKRRKGIAGLYLIYNPITRTYYVGQSGNMSERYDAETRSRVVAFVDEKVKAARLAIEWEAIEFCRAFGLPITNKVGVPRDQRWQFN